MVVYIIIFVNRSLTPRSIFIEIGTATVIQGSAMAYPTMPRQNMTTTAYANIN